MEWKLEEIGKEEKNGRSLLSLTSCYSEDEIKSESEMKIDREIKSESEVDSTMEWKWAETNGK